MSVKATTAVLSVVSCGVACGPETGEELAEASWVVGRFTHGEGCSARTLDESGNPITLGWIIDCTIRRYAEVEFFADGRVRSEFYECHDDGTPYVTEDLRWRATDVDGEVIVDAEGEQRFGLLYVDTRMESATIRRQDDCTRILAEENDDDAPAFAIMHRGEFEWVDLMPSDGCEETAQPTTVPECPEP